jgi:hypothetical protein
MLPDNPSKLLFTPGSLTCSFDPYLTLILHRQMAQHSMGCGDVAGKASWKLIFHVFAVLAKFERNLIRERTMAMR